MTRTRTRDELESVPHDADPITHRLDPDTHLPLPAVCSLERPVRDRRPIQLSFT
ncbi:hypothetical protein AArcMg_3413 [Natrarchaeobaculum sulfurireducens]|uniref:Uncharacterized protein n=1 Tax=Natrarchaeobaculum sulfurireducens TaxID=2044521 RepID=A0A346PJC5_9EURY|nr:hypothetical protein AArc1_3319 [Natrarchaeobaculum sulfurireducens]AXR83393.1 hypothetical protein AArcMg_3413 [Natrarchaeobaculum sulfurireducens]